MSPSEFIAIAEEIGLIVDLGMFVLDQTARQLSIWQRAMRSREPIFASVKIDQSFVRTSSRGTRPVILKSIIAMAHDLGMDVVAEGAETDSDAVELYQLGCEYAQGFAFGEPMDADAAMRLLTEERLEAAS